MSTAEIRLRWFMKIHERQNSVTNKVIKIPGHLQNFRSFFNIEFLAIGLFDVSNTEASPIQNCNKGYKPTFYFLVFILT
jgi:hypothetical protein